VVHAHVFAAAKSGFDSTLCEVVSSLSWTCRSSRLCACASGGKGIVPGGDEQGLPAQMPSEMPPTLATRIITSSNVAESTAGSSTNCFGAHE